MGLNGDVPKEWVDCKIIPVHKKGAVNDPENYWGIALLSTGGKVFRRILARRLLQHVVPHVVPETQCGFRPGHSTEDLILVICQLFEKVKEKNTTLYATFVDFSKAFDSVDRGLLWLVLLKMLAALRNLHQGKEGYVQYMNESFGRFLIRTGV